MDKAVRWEVEAGQAATVELSEEAVYAKALRDIEARVKDLMRTLKRLPLPPEVSGMTKITASIYAAMAQVGDDEPKRRRPPSSAAIDRIVPMVECLRKVEPEEARNLLMVRGLGLKWEDVIDELGLDCTIRTAQRKHQGALVQLLCVVLDRDAKNG